MVRKLAFLVLAAGATLGVGNSGVQCGAEPVAPQEVPSAEELALLVQQLGSESFGERHAAEERLDRIGYPALDALRAALARTKDLELRRRAERLAAAIPDRDFQKMFGEKVASVEKILPPGWAITRTVPGTVPPDWHSDQPTAGFLVEAGHGKEVLRICFLPLDWIGIRKVSNQSPTTCYWEGILVGDRYKTIAFASDEKMQECVKEIAGGLSTPSLVNSGYPRALEIFPGIPEADRAAQALIVRHCRTPAEFAEAAHSLVVLGVPARNVLLRAAREVDGPDRDFFCSALGLLGGAEAIGLLCEIVADPRVAEGQRKYAVMALRGHADARIGPALHTALRQMGDSEALEQVVRGLKHRRYEAATADLLAAFRRLPKDSSNRHGLAQALAAFRCQAVVPDLERWLRDLRQDSRTAPSHLQDAELSLLRLTGDWGQPGESLRVLLLPPVNAVVGQKMEISIYEENCGNQPQAYSRRTTEESVLLDGNPLVVPQRVRRIRGFAGNRIEIEPGEVHAITLDLDPYINTPGNYSLQYAYGGAESAIVCFQVRAKEP